MARLPTSFSKIYPKGANPFPKGSGDYYGFRANPTEETFNRLMGIKAAYKAKQAEEDKAGPTKEQRAAAAEREKQRWLAGEPTIAEMQEPDYGRKGKPAAAPKPKGMFPVVSAAPEPQVTDSIEPKQPSTSEEIEVLNKAEEGWGKLTNTDKLRLAAGGACFLGAAAIGAVAIGTALGATTAVSAAATVGKKTVQTTLSGGIVKTARFVTNSKSLTLTKSFLKKLGSPTALIAVIGSYPFAGFIKEEALQTLSFGILSARNSGNLEGEQKAINEVNEVLNPGVWQQILNKIPFANIVSQLRKFYKAAKTKNKLDQESLNKRLMEVGGESAFEKERRESDEAARERELGYREEDVEYYGGIEEKKGEREAKEREEESERYTQIEEENRMTKLREQELDAEYYKLIREKKWDEAEALWKSRIKG